MSGAPDFRSARVPIAIGLLSVAVLVGGVGVWAAGTEIAGAVVASGVVKAEGERQVVQHPDGGVVGTILARDGDQVSAGDLLLQFDDTFLRSELEIIERQLFELHARKTRLAAERDFTSSLSISVPADLDHLDPAWTTAQLSGQIALFEARQKALAQELEQLDEQQVQIERQIDGLNAQLTAKETEMSLVAVELADQTNLYDKGLVPAARLTELRRSQARLQGEIGELQGRIGETGAQVAALAIKKLQLRERRREEAMTQLRDLRYSEIELAERRLAGLETLARMDVRAPMGGTVFGSVVLAEKSVVRAADPMMYIVPKDGPVQVVVRIEPVHIDQVHAGQLANLRFTSFDQRTTPVIPGEVVRVAADASDDPRTGTSFYEAVIQVQDPANTGLADRKVLPGMPVEVYLRTADRTAMSYLVKPFSDYFSRAFREN